MIPDADLAIVGSGFGGSLLAMIARRLGLRVMLLERGHHPRFAIGESASPLAGVVLEQLADRYGLPRIRPLASFGEWQRHYPEIVCGLKRGFTYFKHEPGARYRTAADRANQLLVAASPGDDVADTHWLRADVDHFLVREAIALGVEYVDCAALDDLAWAADGTAVLSGSRNRTPLRIRARGVVDASGPRGFVSRALGIGDRGFDGYPATQALYSHFVGVARCDQMADFCVDRDEVPPYPMDDAALHHVFDGGWMWVLRFGNGVTSAGIAVTDTCATELGLADGEPAWLRFLARYPSIAAQFSGASAIREFRHMPRLAYRASAAAGDRWAMLPSAAAFIDPLFSTGIPLTLLGIERLARALEAGWLTASPTSPESGPCRHVKRARDHSGSWSPADYSRTTLAEADHAARFLGGCYAAFPRFEEFTAYSMFYFVAASFAEMARRLDRASQERSVRLQADLRRPAEAGHYDRQKSPAGFLRADDRDFADAIARLSPAAASSRAGHVSLDEIARLTDHLNIAGLSDPAKRNWYGVDVRDLLRGAAKLGVAAHEIVASASGEVRRAN